MASASASSLSHRSPDNLFCLDGGGYLTANLEEARRVCAAQGGFLFRMDHLFLVGDYEEALAWGWSPFHREERLTGRA